MTQKTRSYQHRVQPRLLTFLVVILALLMSTPPAVHADRASERQVEGRGFFTRIAHPTMQEDLIRFTCTAVASPDPAATFISSCRLVLNSETVASAQPVAVPGPAAVTTGSYTYDPNEGGALSVCLDIGAIFPDAEIITASGCGLVVGT